MSVELKDEKLRLTPPSSDELLPIIPSRTLIETDDGHIFRGPPIVGGTRTEQWVMRGTKIVALHLLFDGRQLAHCPCNVELDAEQWRKVHWLIRGKENYGWAVDSVTADLLPPILINELEPQPEPLYQRLVAPKRVRLRLFDGTIVRGPVIVEKNRHWYYSDTFEARGSDRIIGVLLMGADDEVIADFRCEIVLTVMNKQIRFTFHDCNSGNWGLKATIDGIVTGWDNVN